MLKPLKSLAPDKKPELENEFVDPAVKVKNTTRYKKKGENLLYGYFNNGTYITSTQAADYEIWRRYAQGNQPNTKYKDILCPFAFDKESKTNMRVTYGYENISWQIFSIMPKMRARVLGQINEIDYAVDAQAIDEKSKNEKYSNRLKVLAEIDNREMYMEMYAAAGSKPPQTNLPYEPKSLEDVEMMEKMGSIKLGAEIEIEVKVGTSLDHSRWDTLQQALKADEVDCGISITKDYNDPVTGEPMVRYVNPTRFIARASISETYDNITEAAEVILVSIMELKAAGLTEEQLWKAVKASGSKWGNPVWLNQYSLNNPQDRFDAWSSWLYKYSEWKVAVLDAECDTLDTEQWEIKSINGEEKAYKLPYGQKKVNDNRSRILKKEYSKWHRYKWVIGTDVVYDYGYQFDQYYDQAGRPRSSYTAKRVSDISMVGQCVATLDDIQIAVQKLRSATAKSRPAGLDIEVTSMAGIEIGGQKFDPWQLIAIYTGIGARIWKKSINPNTGTEVQGGMPPIQDNLGSPPEEMLKFVTQIDTGINYLREITGLSQATDGSAPIPGQLKGTTEISAQGTNYVLQPLLTSYRYVKSQVCRNLAYRHQLQQKMEVLQKRASGSALYLAALPDMHSREFDIKVEAVIDQGMKAKIEEMALVSLNAAKQGDVGITPADYFYIIRLVNLGQLKYAQFYLSAREHELNEQANERALQNQQANNEGVMMQKKIDQETEQMKHFNKMDEIRVEKDLELRNAIELAKIKSQEKAAA